MGTPLPENPLGDDSIGCWGSGKPFGTEGTPHILTLHFTGWTESGQFEESDRLELAPPKQLYQTVNPLIWQAYSDTYEWSIRLLSFQTVCTITKLPIRYLAFRSTPSPGCGIVFENNLVAPTITVTLGGVVTLSFSQVFTS